MTTPSPPPDVLAAFGIAPTSLATSLGAGHIHRNWRVDGVESVAVQRVNEGIFRDTDALARNLGLLETVLVSHDVPTLRWRRDASGAILVRGERGGLWRAYDWVPGDAGRAVSTMQDVEGIGRAFGCFAGALADTTPDAFTPTIAGFHDFTARERSWRFAVLRDDARRFLRAQPDVERAAGILERLHDLDEFEVWNQLPPRIVHNDAKAVNVVRSGARCTIIDLDTTMPGPLLADLGELVRTVCRGASEDDDHAAHALQTERVGLLIRGWLEGYARPLHPLEALALPIAGIVLTVENALRFLTDYLEGDRYFAVDRPDHNRSRFRTQIGHAQVLLDGINDLRRVASHELQRRT